MLFSERISKRQHLGWKRRGTLRERLHHKREMLVLRSPGDPESAWHCCERWQRALLNKWNGRTFAARMGIPTPELYWNGRIVSQIPLDRLPERFVIKPVIGYGMHGMFLVDGDVCRTGTERFPRRELAARLRKSYRPIRLRPLIVEELICSDDGEHSIDYKFHMFRDVIGAITVSDFREGMADRRSGTFTAEWQPRAVINAGARPLGDMPRPACFDEMARLAKRCGETWGSYVRVDFLLRRGRCVFGEFSSCPSIKGIVAETDRDFGRLWDEICPDRE